MDMLCSYSSYYYYYIIIIILLSRPTSRTKRSCAKSASGQGANLFIYRGGVLASGSGSRGTRDEAQAPRLATDEAVYA